MKKTYRVVRAHQGDKPYEVGDTREGEDHELAHLVPNVLVEAKAEREHANKSVDAPLNKRGRPRKDEE